MGLFGTGIIQGAQAAQDFQLRRQELDLNKKLNDARLKQMDTEQQLGQLQLGQLIRKIEAEGRLPGIMEGLGGPVGQPLRVGAIGPPEPPASPEIDRTKLRTFLQVAQQAGQDPGQLLSIMSLTDPRIAAIQAELEPEQFMKLGEGETLVGLKKRAPRTPAAPVPPPALQAAEGQSLPVGAPEITTPEIAVQPTGPAVGPGARIVAQGPPKQKEMKVSVEESKVIGELASMFPEKMATLQQALGRPPTFNEAGQFFTPAEFSQSFRAREERTRAGQIEVAQQTGLAAAERQLELAQKKEKIPEKPTSAERKDFAQDQIALEQARGIIDKFDPQFVGPIAGRVGNINELIGTLGFDEAEFRGVVARTRNATIKAITGAQMGEREADRIRQELPEFHLSPEAFIARMRLTYANLYDMARIRRQIAADTGIDLSGLKALVPPAELDPEIRAALRKQAGLTPIGAAKEKQRQGQAATEETEFLQLLPADVKPRYQKLSPGDKARFREKYLKKLETIPQVLR